MQGGPATEFSVRWIGSIALRKPLVPGLQPCPSPGTPSSGSAARRFPRSTNAAARSASAMKSRGHFRPISSASRHRKCRSAGVMPASCAARSASNPCAFRFIVAFPAGRPWLSPPDSVTGCAVVQRLRDTAFALVRCFGICQLSRVLGASRQRRTGRGIRGGKIAIPYTVQFRRCLGRGSCRHWRYPVSRGWHRRAGPASI